MLLAAAPGLLALAVLMFPLGLPLSPWLGSPNASVQRRRPGAFLAAGGLGLLEAASAALSRRDQPAA